MLMFVVYLVVCIGLYSIAQKLRRIKYRNAHHRRYIKVTQQREEK